MREAAKPGWTVSKAVFVFMSALLFVACSMSDDFGLERHTRASDSTPTTKSAEIDGGSASAPGVPCPVDTIVRAKCQTCHGAQPSAGASVSLVTYDDFQRDHGGKKVFQVVGERIHDVARPMPEKPAGLTPVELSTLDSWIGAGAPISTDTCALSKAPNGVKPLSCKPNVTLKSPQAFTMPNIPGVSDIYMCFGASDLLTKKRHVIGFGPHIDNAKIVHHILLFKSAFPVPPTPLPCDGVLSSAVMQVVAGWAPGAENFELPPEAGFPDDVGLSNWVMQVHYNSGGGKYVGESDQSGFDMCTTEDLRPNDAGIAGFGTLAIAIPPRSNVAMTCHFPAGPLWWGKKFFNSFPHMHGRGSAMTTKLVGLSGERVVSDENFDFNDQGNRPVDAVVKPGDIIQTRCAWKNPSDSLVTFGEGTENEMCFNFLAYYPAIPLYPWQTPSLSPLCVPEIGF